MSRMKFGVFAILFAATTLGAGAAKADSDNDIKYRKAIMKAVGGHMGSMAAIITGKVPHKGDWKPHADALAAMASVTPHVFPDGSDFGETAAKPEVWDKPDDFKKALAVFKTAADAMATTAATGDLKAGGAALKALAKTCGGCHDAFREKNDH